MSESKAGSAKLAAEELPQTFAAMGIERAVLMTLEEGGSLRPPLDEPCVLQQRVLPGILKGFNCLCIAPPRSGKTIAMSLAAAQRELLDSQARRNAGFLVLTPNATVQSRLLASLGSTVLSNPSLPVSVGPLRTLGQQLRFPLEAVAAVYVDDAHAFSEHDCAALRSLMAAFGRRRVQLCVFAERETECVRRVRDELLSSASLRVALPACVRGLHPATITSAIATATGLGTGAGAAVVVAGSARASGASTDGVDDDGLSEFGSGAASTEDNMGGEFNTGAAASALLSSASVFDLDEPSDEKHASSLQRQRSALSATRGAAASAGSDAAAATADRVHHLVVTVSRENEKIEVLCELLCALGPGLFTQPLVYAASAGIARGMAEALQAHLLGAGEFAERERKAAATRRACVDDCFSGRHLPQLPQLPVTLTEIIGAYIAGFEAAAVACAGPGLLPAAGAADDATDSEQYAAAVTDAVRDWARLSLAPRPRAGHDDAKLAGFGKAREGKHGADEDDEDDESATDAKSTKFAAAAGGAASSSAGGDARGSASAAELHGRIDPDSLPAEALAEALIRHSLHGNAFATVAADAVLPGLRALRFAHCPLVVNCHLPDAFGYLHRCGYFVQPPGHAAASASAAEASAAAAVDANRGGGGRDWKSDIENHVAYDAHADMYAQAAAAAAAEHSAEEKRSGSDGRERERARAREAAIEAAAVAATPARRRVVLSIVRQRFWPEFRAALRVALPAAGLPSVRVACVDRAALPALVDRLLKAR